MISEEIELEIGIREFLEENQKKVPSTPHLDYSIIREIGKGYYPRGKKDYIIEHLDTCAQCRSNLSSHFDLLAELREAKAGGDYI